MAKTELSKAIEARKKKLKEALKNTPSEAVIAARRIATANLLYTAKESFDELQRLKQKCENVVRPYALFKGEFTYVKDPDFTNAIKCEQLRGELAGLYNTAKNKGNGEDSEENQTNNGNLIINVLPVQSLQNPDNVLDQVLQQQSITAKGFDKAGNIVSPIRPKKRFKLKIRG